MTKTVDRFHHAAEDKNMAGATEALDLFEKARIAAEKAENSARLIRQKNGDIL